MIYAWVENVKNQSIINSKKNLTSKLRDIIIGAGVVGSACARELNRYKLKFWFWTKKRMYAAVPAKQILQWFMLEAY